MHVRPRREWCYAPPALNSGLFLTTTTFALAGLLAGCDSCSKSQPAAGDAAPSATTIPDAAPINATPIPAASVAKMVNPQNLPAYAGPTGSVEGTITVTGDPAPETPGDFSRCPDAASVYGHAFRDGKTPAGSRWLADAVVAITGYSGFFVPEQQDVESLTITGCAFDRRTVTMTFGQRLEVKNLTNDFWTPKLDPPQATMMMMATPHGDPVKLYPKQAGHYHLIDHDRKYAVDDVYAFRHSLHTASKVGGTYRIDGVPVGKLKVNAFHPAMRDTEAVKEIEITAGGVARADLELVYKTPPDAGAPVDAGPPLRLH